MAWSRTNALIETAASRLGVRVEPLTELHTDFLVRLRASDRTVLVSKTRSPFLTQVAQTLANNKAVSRRLLAGAGVPVVPDLLVCGSPPESEGVARAWLAEWRRVAVKPNWGNRAAGVTVGVTDAAKLASAIARARAVDLAREVLLEPELGGANLRLAVVGGRFVAAAEIRRPVARGDGRRTMGQLLAEIDADPRRQPSASGLPSLDSITRGDDLMRALAVDGVLGLDATPPAGWEHELLAEEDATIDRTDEIHPSWRQLAERACARLGVDVGGVDVRGDLERLCGAPPASEWRPGEPAVLEVNVLPGLHVHALPTHGRPQPVFDAFVAYCLQLSGAPAPCATVPPE